MPISHKHKVIFVHIPKTGGSSIEYVLGMHGNKEEIGIKRYFNQYNDQEMLYGGGMQHWSAETIKECVGVDVFDRYFKFAIMRDPFDRVVSDAAWLGGKWANNEELTQQQFDQYITNLQSKARRGIYDNHTRPQFTYILPHNKFTVPLMKSDIMVDYLGTFDQLSSCWKTVSDHIGLDAELPVRMKSHHKSPDDYFTSHSRAVVREIYAKDIEIIDMIKSN